MIAGRRKVRARRAGEDAPPSSAPATSNPFSGISLFPTAPPPAPAASNPFSGFNLVPPSATEPAPAPKEEKPEVPEAKETPLPAPAAEEPPKQTANPVGSFGFGSYSSNAFASLNNGANTTPIGGFGGGGFGGFGGGGGFGSAISKAPTATPPASPLFVALPTPGTSGFAFTTGSFPSIAPQGVAAFKTPMTEGGGGDAEGDDNVEVFADSTAEFKPLVTLPEAQKTVTGEEEEITAYTASDAVLYEFLSLDGKWVERGKGEFRLNFQKPQGSDDVPKARMILRQSGSLRLLLNALVYHNMACSLMSGGGGVSFAAHNVAAAAPSSTPEPSSAPADGSTPPASPSPLTSVVLTTWAVKVRGRGAVDPIGRLFSLINDHKEALVAKEGANEKGGQGAKVDDESKV